MNSHNVLIPLASGTIFFKALERIPVICLSVRNCKKGKYTHVNTKAYPVRENTSRTKWLPPGAPAASNDVSGNALCLAAGFGKKKDTILNSASQTPGAPMNY